MRLQVEATETGHRLVGNGVDVELINRFLKHLLTRNFAAATRRAYAYDLLIFGRFCAERSLSIGALSPSDVFDFLDWQSGPRRPGGDERTRTVVPLRDYRGAAPATMNRRIAALRGLCEYAVLAGVRADNPVPAARRSSGARVRRGLLGHLGPGRPRGGGRLARTPRRLPEALDAAEVAAFIADLRTARDRAMALLMLLGGLRAGEVRALLLSDVDQGLRRVHRLTDGAEVVGQPRHDVAGSGATEVARVEPQEMREEVVAEVVFDSSTEAVDELTHAIAENPGNESKTDHGAGERPDSGRW